METIQTLLKFLFKMAIALFIMWVLLWLVGMFFPTFKFKNILSLSQSGDWLPAPGSWGLLGTKARAPTANDNVYRSGPAYNAYDNAYNYYNANQTDFITYSTNGTQIRTTVNTSNIYDQGFNGITSQYTSTSLYLRNLSIYQGGHVYTGLTFTGEARDTMFNSGKFPIIIADQTGNVVGIAIAEATTNWATPGWVRFTVKINSVLPNKVPCTMVFQSATNYTGAQPIRIMVPILCN